MARTKQTRSRRAFDYEAEEQEDEEVKPTIVASKPVAPKKRKERFAFTQTHKFGKCGECKINLKPYGVGGFTNGQICPPCLEKKQAK